MKSMGRPRIRTMGSPTLFTKETWASERPDLDPSDYLFQVHLARLGQHISRLHDQYCRKMFGLSGQDVRMLIILKRFRASHAPNPAELAEAQMMTTGAITKQLIRLERAGYLERRPHPEAGVAVHATEKGLALAERAMSAQVGNSPMGEVRQSLSKQERDALADLCEKLLLHIEKL